MRYTALLFVLLLISSNTFGRSNSTLQQPISINVTQKTLDDVFTLISQQSGVLFSYNPLEINSLRVVSLQANAEPLSSVLDKLLGSSITYKQHGSHIILLPSKVEVVEAVEVKNNQPNPKAQPFISEKIDPTTSGSSELICHSSITTKNDEEMKKQLAALMLTIATSTTVSEVAAQQPETTNSKPFQLSLVYPLGTDGTRSINHSYNFSVNLIGGTTGGTKGTEFGGILNINSGTTKGGQFAGIANFTKKVEGAQLAGILNASQSSNKATQVAGIANATKSGDVSAQLSGIINLVEFSRVQAAGIANVAKSSKVQMAGIANISKEGENTVQFSGIANAAKSTKVQASGIANIADSATCQAAGIVNVAHKSKVQVGFINISDEAKVQVGLVNISKNGFIEGEVASGEFLQSTISFRSGNNRLYGIVSMGYNFDDEFWGMGAGIGKTFELGSKTGLNLELMHFGLTTKKFDSEKYNGLSQIRPIFYYKVAKHFKLFAGPVLNLLNYNTTTSNKLKVTAPYTIWSDTEKDMKQEAWVGFTAGIRF